MAEVLWQPDPARRAATAVERFRREAAARWHRDLADWDALYRWSVDHREEFWASVWDFGGVRASRGCDQVLVDPDRMPGSRWFVGARLNFAENLLRRAGPEPALIALGERAPRRELSWDELRREVARCAAALAAAGVGAGDRVAGFLPNVPETVIAMLGAASLGAIWSSCSPDFGAQGVSDRFGQISPKVLIATDGYLYGGKSGDVLPTVARLRAVLAGLVATVIVPNHPAPPDLAGLPGAVAWRDWLDAAPDRPLAFHQAPFDHPLFILFSSGTTGLPKCLVHGAGGTLLQHVKEHQLHCDLGPGDRLFYYTTCGWMMWNWLASGLASGATLVLYDGSATAPRDVLWRLADAERVTVFGVSARYLAACEKFGLRPGAARDLSTLRTLLSTGSPLAPASFDWVYREVKSDLQLSSISGGTDIVSCFALGSPVLPVRRGELQCRGLGMAVAVFDDEGREVIGRPGELVCTKSFPSLPTGLWNDPDGSRYRATYFERFPGVWHHGDWAEVRPGGGLLIHGRSDATLNPGGVRIGTAEIYRVVDRFTEVVESLVTVQRWAGDERIVLFVHLRDGLDLDDPLGERIRQQIRRETTPRHVPAKIVQVPAIPRTLSGKTVELAVRRVIHGETVENRDALANPESLDHFRDLDELRH
ncbi:MAG TPA: acetoacetate--CoA ligase [Candidatus Krumholzibacteria bacterium]|nr:acetoacetate--CoA ligase [Candidatus Krumholzibacteria bacterium]HPD72145.1 acetoacetate--CoA ligase [Candidatus Krumholzibacteria bacterium]HRY40923.1 acetoacetate--CoA ligase [Candidatus Krumholzibacteria bacterium]